MKIKIILLNFSLFLCLIPASAKSTLYPSQADSVGKLLCQSIDLNYPGLELVKLESTKGNYAAALEAWRDYKVLSFRKNKVSLLLRHNNFIKENSELPYANFIIGKLTKEQLLTYKGCMHREEFLLYNYNSPLNTPSNINWLVKNPDGTYPAQFPNFFYFCPLVANYYLTGEVINLKKYFQIAADFACRQKLMYQNSIAKGIDLNLDYNCDWSTKAQQALSESDRVRSIIPSLAIFSKCLQKSTKPSTWGKVNLPINQEISKDSLKIIPAIELAQITFSLVFDHPKPLMDRYLTAGAVPNQRQSGLIALLEIATQFPEFLKSPEIKDKTFIGLDDYISYTMNKDGGMLEASFNYNLSAAVEFGALYEEFKTINPLLAQKFLNAQRDYYRMYAGLLSPVGIIPAMSSSGPTAPPNIWTDESVRNAQLLGTSKFLEEKSSSNGQYDSIVGRIAASFNPTNKKPLPTFTSVKFPYSGYYVQRKNWNWDSPYLFFYNRRPSRGHFNLGSNSIQLTAFGRPLLVTAGKPIYTTGQMLNKSLLPDFNAINDLMGERTTLKSNTVIVDGKSQVFGNVAQKAYDKPIAARWLSTSNFDFLEGNYDLGYSNAKVEHRRQVIFVKEQGFWIIADIMTNLDTITHTFSQIWNFPAYQVDPSVGPSKCYGFKENEVVLGKTTIHTTDSSGPNVWMYHFGEKPVSYTKYYGQKNPYLGWFCPAWGEFVPAPQIFTNWTSAKSSILITVIWPTKKGDKPAFSKMENLSTLKDSAYAGFSMTLKDGRKLKYEISNKDSRFVNKIKPFMAQSLLTISRKNGDILSLITAQTDSDPVVYECNKIDGVVCGPIDNSKTNTTERTKKE
ncbi:MAG: heparinase II/III domain-containing protein [Paludibacter sp.]